MSNSSAIAVPMATTNARISSDASILSMRDFSTFKILPLSGNIACVRRFLPCFDEPPALSPSTINISDSSGFFDEQSASLPGKVNPSSAPLRITVSRAAFAAIRAFEASMTFPSIARASLGLRSNQSANSTPKTVSTAPRASGVPSFAFVCPSNCASWRRTETTEVNPSRTSSPVRFSSFSFR